MTYRYRGTGKSDPKLDRLWAADQKKNKSSWKPGKAQQNAKAQARKKPRAT